MVYIWEHQDDGCDSRGEGRVCISEGGTPIVLPAGSTFDQGQFKAFRWEADLAWEHSPRALRIYRTKDAGAQINFKYGLDYNGGPLRWSVTPGTAFLGENVRVRPSGPDYQNGDCKIVKCEKEDTISCTDGLRIAVKEHVRFEKVMDDL